MFTGTLVRDFPGTTEYLVHEVYAGEVAERILVTSPYEGSSCSPGTRTRGDFTYFLGSDTSGIVSAAEADGCTYASIGPLTGTRDHVEEHFREALGPPRAPDTTFLSGFLGVAEWPLTWFADRRVQAGIAITAVLLYAVYYFRSRFGS